MKKLLFLFLLFHTHSIAQKSDNVWLLGYHYYPWFVPALDFYYGNPDTIAWNSPIEFFGADASICSPAGDLQFYTNGVGIFNYLNDTLAGSNKFNYDSTSMGAPYNINYMPQQSAIILPYPGNPGKYYIFHLSMHLFNNNANAQPIAIKSSIVDMNANNGEGLMTVKNQTLANDTMLYFTLQATKHGNGRDWWVIVHRWQSNIFYRMLLSPYGVTINTQAEGPYMAHNSSAQGQSVFSPDGNMFALVRSDSNMVNFFYFDRCNGLFLFRETFTPNPGEYVTGCSFSPNSQQLYVSTSLNLYQYQVNAPVVSATQLHIGTWDGAGSFNGYYFRTHRLGPNGVIYVATPSSQYLHTINNPDMLDTLCDFKQHSLKLKSYHAGYLPEFPNYRLGNLQGSPCDSLNYTGIPEYTDMKLSVFPNPADNFINIDFPVAISGNETINLHDMEGRIIHSIKPGRFSYQHTIDVSSFAKGIYILRYDSQKGNLNSKVIIN